MSQKAQNAGMSAATAKRAELAIIALCIGAVVMIFQPFSSTVFTAGCILVVVGGLAFNLVPLCTPGRTVAALIKGAGVVLAVFAVVIALALGSAYLYGLYLGG